MTSLPDLIVAPIVRRTLEEDLGLAGDITAALIDADATLRARFVVRKSGVVCGLQPARIACTLVAPEIRFQATAQDGDVCVAGAVIAEAEGPARAILTAERTALNFLTMMSGTATLTRAFVDAVSGTSARIAATRKTLPGLRALQKYAVRCGGGWPHRYALSDAVLVKDNHIAAAGGVGEAMRRARASAGHMAAIEIEIDRLDQLEDALAHRPNVVLLDNFSLDDLREAVSRAKGRALLEASGGVTLDTAAAIAATGVDVISVGALTHSAPALDIGLDAM
ncbi:MAG: carboxylating nicotinate-nucleotide diphosphorylase [Alphaproteobacteria bacterium]|nr:carboxylating nicotinate-nucleotide diphosphorylase [Alphaproteobacteria bacterium]